MRAEGLSWLRERGDKWNEKQGANRVVALVASLAWQFLATYLHSLARGERLQAVWDLVRWLPHTHEDRAVAVQDPSGKILRLPATIGAKHASLGLFQLPEKAFVLHLAEPGDLMLDVGAFVGDFTVPMASRGANVHAFEPVQASRTLLETNVRVNELDELVTIHALALGDTQGEVRITNEFGSGNRVTTGEATSAQSELVTVTTLDAWSEGRDLGCLVLVKVDAEGMDERILAGAERILGKYEPALIVEFLDGSTSLQNRLITLGYQAYRYDVESGTLVPFAAMGGANNIIACTPSRYESLSRRLAAKKRPDLKRPTVRWAKSTATGTKAS